MHTVLTISILAVAGLFPTAAQACHYNAEEVERNLASALYIGKAEIIRVEKTGDSEFDRPTVTYKILEPENRASGFSQDIVTIKGGPLSSCDALGPWTVGAVVEEVFFMQGGHLRSSTLNMNVKSPEIEKGN